MTAVDAVVDDAPDTPTAADPYADAINALLAWNPEPFFVQVGGFDGVSFDPLRPHVAANPLSGLIVEPIPQNFEKLRQLYTGSDRVIPINCAVTEEDGERTIWRFMPAAIEQGLLPAHFGGISSFLMENLLSDNGVLGRSCPDEGTKEALRTLVEPVPVQCRRFDTLFAEHGVHRVDLLQIDTNGFDLRILQLFDFDRYHPTVVHYEHQHLNPADRQTAEALLRSYGYRLTALRFDTLAVLDRERLAVADTPGLLRLAERLEAEGRSEDALFLARHVHALVPDHEGALYRMVRLNGALGRAPDTIDALFALRAVARDREMYNATVQEQLSLLLDRFNAAIASGDLIAVERYAVALADLLPANPRVVEAAMTANRMLGRNCRAAHYARQLLALAPDKLAAHVFLIEHCRETADAEGECEHQLALALSPNAGISPLVRMQEQLNAISLLFLRRLDDETLAKLRRVKDAADAVVVTEETESDWEMWEKSFRLLLEAMDLPSITTPLVPTPPPVEPAYADHTGAPLRFAEVQAQAARLNAKVAFFVAADMNYVEQYGRLFARSILRYVDQPCLIVIHVIGGRDRLTEAAATVGVNDTRLVFAGDGFDAASVTTRCYDGPPTGQFTLPAAHYQSVRFQALGPLLEGLGLPVFVSDIDCLLQRGVGDLLERCRDADIVLNENTLSPAAASRITANLLLLNPTPRAAHFATFLRVFLDDALARPEVTRWIDQIALLMGRHHMEATVPDVRIAFFDTKSDINNVMLRSYREHPFRFFSLYRGFDLASIDPELTAADPVLA